MENPAKQTEHTKGDVIKQLTAENEQLFQQFSHLMIRNNKLLKRLDDQQQIIDNLHIRIEELQLINDNLIKINNGIRVNKQSENNHPLPGNDYLMGVIDSLSRRIDDLHAKNEVLLRSMPDEYRNQPVKEVNEKQGGVDAELLFEKWKNIPGQFSKNTPNLRKQSQMIQLLYAQSPLSAAELFSQSGVNGVTGARYVASLKKFGMIEYKGARKKGKYSITESGKLFVEKNETVIADTSHVSLSIEGVHHPRGESEQPVAMMFDQSDL